MAEDANKRYERQRRMTTQLSGMQSSLAEGANKVTRAGIKEVVTLVDAFVVELKKKDSAEASKAYETLMRKVHSVEAGIEAAIKIKAIFSTVKDSFGDCKNALYTISCAMRESQSVVIGKPQIENEDTVNSAEETCKQVKKVLEACLKIDEEDWIASTAK